MPDDDSKHTTRQAELSQAVALKYEAGDIPRVVAKGKGYIAQRIIEIAKESDIPIQQDQALTKALSSLEINESIPTELFSAVAQVLIFAYSLRPDKAPPAPSSSTY